MDSPVAAFRVRSPTYLVDRVKEPPGEPLMRLVDTCVGREPAVDPGPDAARLLAVDFVCPDDLTFGVVFRETRRDPRLDHFFESDDDEFRRQRLKLIPMCAAGPWVVRCLMGRPAIVARALDTTFQRAPGLLRVTINVAGSRVARGIFGRVTGAMRSVVMDLGFVVEATEPDELPERILCGVRLDRVDFRRLVARVAAGHTVHLPGH
jgi:hypothetical protein